MCKPGFWEKAMYRKATRVTDHLDQVLDTRNDAANRWQTQQKEPKKNGSNVFQTKRVLSKSWAELSPAHGGRRIHDHDITAVSHDL